MESQPQNLELRINHESFHTCTQSNPMGYIGTTLYVNFSAHLNYLMEENDDIMTLPDEFIRMYEKPFDIIPESG